MAQAARSAPPVPVAVPGRDRLRVVPPPRRLPRRPAPAVVRRRRAVALGCLAALVALSAAVVLGAGGATGAGRIAALLQRVMSDPPVLCDHLSSAMLQAAGGHAACVRASPARAPRAMVRDVRVGGSTASAIVSTGQVQERVRLVRQHGAWRVDDIR
jgi:hypothetical protein